jgi:hypothetical protein
MVVGPTLFPISHLSNGPSIINTFKKKMFFSKGWAKGEGRIYLFIYLFIFEFNVV